MEKPCWTQIKAAFAQAFDLPPEERSAFLNQIADPALRYEVEVLLDPGTGFMEQPAGELLHIASEDMAVPQRIGPYRIVDELGRGGMGVVYRAERDDGQYQQTVAIKIVSTATWDVHRIYRFRAERQILATLTHPNIARLYDGGHTEEGLPYLIMEYIEGQPLDVYCDENRLSIPARLKLFQKVCSAVQYAHQNLVVHRDLKPSNILVNQAGEPKLLDFGIAKLLEPDVDALTLTKEGMHLMTPEYAAPEQIKGEIITTSTDVYSLGVLLFKLLTGQSPYQLKSRLLHEMARVICEEEPLRPSTAIVKTDNTKHPITLSEISDARSTPMVRLQRELRGDLDNIVLKALHKVPELRYNAVAELSDDLTRYLTGQPVSAQQQTITYRAQKFIRRHRGGVAITAAVSIVSLIGIFAYYLQSLEVIKERDRAELIVHYITGLFDVLDPEQGANAHLTEAAKEIIDEGTRQARSELGDRPLDQALLLSVMGDLYEKLGFFDESIDVQEQALINRKRLVDVEHPDYRHSLVRLAIAYKGQEQHYEVADSLFKEALVLYQAAYGTEHEEVAGVMKEYGNVLRRQGLYDSAEVVLRKSYEILLNKKGIEHDKTQEAAMSLGIVLERLQNTNEAEAIYRKVLDTRKKTLGVTHIRTAYSLEGLANILQNQNQLEEADSLMRWAVEIKRAYLGENHPMLAYALNNRASGLYIMGRYDEAWNLLNQALSIFKNRLGEENVSVARTLANMAGTGIMLGKVDEVELMYRRAIAVYRKALGSMHPDVAHYLAVFARFLRDQGNTIEAEVLAEEAVEINRRMLPKIHPSRTTTLLTLGRIQMMNGKPEEAEHTLRECLDIRLEVLSKDDHRIGSAKSYLGQALRQLGRFEESEKFLLEGYENLKNARGENNFFTIQARKRLVELYKILGDHKKMMVYNK